MKNHRLALLALVAISFTVVAPSLMAHCQIPCGIYSDKTQFDVMREHVTTIEKSMKQIEEIGAAEKPNWNQAVRWVNNKEQHADELSEIVTYYFMTQRIKPAPEGDEAAAKKYQHDLKLLHHMLVYSMKAKQTTDVANTAKLNELIDAFEKSYFGEHSH